MSHATYEAAGVSVERGDRFVDRIGSIKSPALGAIGGFAGSVPLDLSKYSEPVIMSCTDGVGTKILVAERLGEWSTIGQDLVAMCVNDLSVCGADPLQFLDYIACARIEESKLIQIVEGIATGCEIAGCTLAGGETAELADMYDDGAIDLAGFAVGVAQKSDILPKSDQIAYGDAIVGIRSRGVHSNGFTLARSALRDAPDDLWRELLVPTRIYCRELERVRSFIKGAAHITGGGLSANIDRLLPEGLTCDIRWEWSPPDIFAEIQSRGSIETAEMRSVFNMGIGIALIADPKMIGQLEAALGEELIPIGVVSGG